MKRRNQLKSRYGVSLGDYDRMLAEQEGVCAICRTSPDIRRLAVDHDHTTGAVRGLLCGTCNRTLAALERNPDWVSTALEYLRRCSLS